MCDFVNTSPAENYFKLPTKEEKEAWLQTRELGKWRDIIFPMIVSCLSVLTFILSIVLMCLPKPTGVTVLSVFLFLFIACICVFAIYSFWINGQGFFLFRYWYRPKPKKDFASSRSSKKEQTPPAPKTTTSVSSQDNEITDLDEF